MNHIGLPIGEMAARYKAGESTRALACAYGVAHDTVWRRLRGAGVRLRTRAEAGGGQLGNKSKLGWHKRGGPLSITSQGYLVTCDRKGKRCKVHRACWEAYHGPIPEGHDVHHIDEDQHHNAIENLDCMLHGKHVSLHHRIRRERLENRLGK